MHIEQDFPTLQFVNVAMTENLQNTICYIVPAVAYLGGHGAMAPLWPEHEIFLQATLCEKVRFLPFFSKFQKKMGEFAASIKRLKAKSVSASPPDPPTRGSAPGPRWGFRPIPPLSRSALCALAMPPLCQILNTPLVSVACKVTLYLRKWKKSIFEIVFFVRTLHRMPVATQNCLCIWAITCRCNVQHCTDVAIVQYPWYRNPPATNIE